MISGVHSVGVIFPGQPAAGIVLKSVHLAEGVGERGQTVVIVVSIQVLTAAGIGHPGTISHRVILVFNRFFPCGVGHAGQPRERIVFHSVSHHAVDGRHEVASCVISVYIRIAAVCPAKQAVEGIVLKGDQAAIRVCFLHQIAVVVIDVSRLIAERVRFLQKSIVEIVPEK